MNPSTAARSGPEGGPSLLRNHLDGGGEMGSLMRALDWDQTALGPVSGWSHSLRTMIGVLLRNPFPMNLFWGPQFIHLYNDGYRAILGTKHPRALGQPCSEIFKEVWEQFAKGLLEPPFTGKPAICLDDLVLLIDRKGFLEETHFKIAHSPVPDETVPFPGVGGVLSTVVETTQQVFGERQLKTLRELAVRAAAVRTPVQACESAAAVLKENSADVPFSLFYLLDPDGNHARLVASHGFASETGLANPAVIELDSASPAGAGWPIFRSVRDRVIDVFKDLPEKFAALPKGSWTEFPRLAISLPLASPEQAYPYGVLIAGMNPHRELDDGYQTFFELAASQVVTAIRNARASEEERAHAEELAAIDRAKTAFFSNVSHEFRTPLTLMLNPLEDALADAALLAPIQFNRLSIVHRNGQRLLKLVNSLLEFSRIEAGRTEVIHQSTELGAFTADLASAFRSLVENAGLTLTVDCPPLAEPIYVDREMYEKIVLNLLSNAFKFTFKGNIRVSLAVHEGSVRLAVADTGVGIANVDLPHLFERFHRVEGSAGRTIEGSGIGLALVQEMVKLHGGQIAVGSELGKGTCFTVSLPLGTASLLSGRAQAAPNGRHVASKSRAGSWSAASFLEEASGWAQNVTAQQIAGPSKGCPLPATQAPPSRKSGHILLADDNADMREYVGKILVEQGWTVEAVGDGKAAIQSARVRRPDLVLTDVMMPGMDGFELLLALRNDEKTAAVPVILLSARAGEAASIEGMQKGADDYLVKPFSGKELVSRVAARVEFARARNHTLALEKAARAAAVAAREELYGLFMQTPVAICIIEGPEHTFTFANPAYGAFVGGRDVVGKRLFEALPEAAGQGFEILMDRVTSSGVPFIGNEVPGTVRRAEDGQLVEIFFNLVYSPKRNARGEIDGLFVCSIDVTEQVRARQRVEALLQDLKVADARKDEFLAMLAHELRNPLAVISMAQTMLERVEGDAVKSAKYRQTAQRQVAHLVRLVDDLLDVSRITRGHIELRTGAIDLATIVENALATIRPTIEARGHALQATIGTGPFRLNADATRLEQVLVNLLVNAAKYTETGGALSVQLDREEVAGVPEAILRVQDNGRGIPKEMLDKIFDPFVQVSPTLDRTTGGLGLGLTLVKRLVEMHGGSVSAYSDGARKGSEFIVRLPLEITSTQASPLVENSRQARLPD